MNTRIYYYLIAGAAGGLNGWLAGTLLLPSVSETLAANQQSVWHQLLYGAVLGAVIGLSLAAYEGAASRSLVRFIKYGGIGFVLGAVGGGAALRLAQLLYSSLLRSEVPADAAVEVSRWQFVLAGTLCWLLLGGVLGLGEGVSKGTQSWKGFVGGAIGGTVGGLFYEFNRPAGDPTVMAGWNQFVLAVSLTLLGAAIGVSIAKVTDVLKEAWLEVAKGKVGRDRFDVTKYVHPRSGSHQVGIIGSDRWRAHVYLPSNGEVLPCHAELSFSNGAPTLTVSPEAVKRGNTLVNSRKASVYTLSDGDRLEIGSTKMIYRQKRK